MMMPKVPQTDSIQELAKFWDTHDLTDFEDQLEEVTEPVFEGQTVISLPLESDEVQAVKRIARSKGVPEADLIHEWVREKISSQ